MNLLQNSLTDYGVIVVLTATLLYILLKGQISFRYPRKKGKRPKTTTD